MQTLEKERADLANKYADALKETAEIRYRIRNIINPDTEDDNE